MILDDTFTNTTQVDSTQTTASVDTVNGWVQLPSKANPNLLAVKPTGNAYAVATPNGVKVFDYDGISMQENTLMAVPGETSAVALAFSPDWTSIWVLSEGNLNCYDYNGAGMALNSALSLNGLANVVALSAQMSQGALVLLSRSGSGTGVINCYYITEGGVLQQVAGLSFDTGITDPVGVAAVPGSMDLIYATAHEVYYYVFDAVSKSYVLNPFLGKGGLDGIVSVSTGAANEYAVLKTAFIEFYEYDQIYGMDLSEEYCTVLPAAGISLAVRPGTSEYLVFDNSGRINYYAFDAGTGTMTEVPALGKSGLNFSCGNFSSPALYQSVPKNLTQAVDSIKLTVFEDNDPGTSLTYQYSVDAGASWATITPGPWIPISNSTSFILKAVFISTDSSKTPRLLRISLEGTKLTLGNLVITEIALPPPGQPVPTSLFPAVIRAGAEFAFEIETDGYASQVLATFSGGGVENLLPVNVVPVAANVWQGTFVVPRDAPLGYVYQLVITAISGISGETISTTVNSFVMVNGTVMQNLRVRLLCTARDRVWALAYSFFALDGNIAIEG